MGGWGVVVRVHRYSQRDWIKECATLPVTCRLHCFSLRNKLDTFSFVPNTVSTAGRDTLVCLVPQEVRTEEEVRMDSDFVLLVR